jgi:hypothetical protein
MSNKIQVVPFKPEHLDLIDLKENFPRGECPKTVMTMAFTFMIGETVVAIIGGFPFVPGVVHFWSFLSKQVRKYPVEFQKKCLDVIRWYEINEKPRRIQWEVRADYPVGQRWAESLGLQREGTLRAWESDGTDAYLYGRVNRCLG